jgi:hypothetical protein
MGKPMYNFGKTANLKAQQQKQMDRDLRRRIAKQSKASIKSNTPNKDSDTTESSKVADIAEGTA